MSGEWTSDLRAFLTEEAVEVGFDLFGVAPAHAPEDGREVLDAERFRTWLAEGRAGEMEYLKRSDAEGRPLRSSVQGAMPWARSVVVCAMNYNAEAARSLDPAALDAGWIARYAWSGRRDEGGKVRATDYHAELIQRLRVLERLLLERAPAETRCYVDTGPLVERTAAERAGVGWIGKNTCVLDQKLGSWMLLGVIVTSLEVPESEAVPAVADRCGSCTRCIDACPTGALVGPRAMDASLCIAYLTIEKKGPIAEELRPKMGRQVFGCDICQEVCPWNGKAPMARKQGLQARPELVNPELGWLAEMDSGEFRRVFKGSPMERTGRKRMQRNVAIAMGNSGDPQFVSRLETWSAGDDAVLAEAAAWAKREILLRHEQAGGTAEHGANLRNPEDVRPELC